MDVAAAKAFPGVVDVIELDDLIAVVAENRYAAEMGKRKLTDVASATGLNADNVEVQTAYLGGGFDRRYALNPYLAH